MIAGALLAPGAGADSNAPALVALDRHLTEAGFAVRRMDFPYRLAGRKAPDRAEVLVAAVVAEADRFRDETGIPASRLFLGGRSMGGRVCSMAVAEGLAAAGLILVSYPLHPPGRPDKLRTAHFPEIGVPCLFVSGTSDAFGSPEELMAATAAIPAPVSHHWIERGDHGLRRHDEAVAAAVRKWAGALASVREA